MTTRVIVADDTFASVLIEADHYPKAVRRPIAADRTLAIATPEHSFAIA
jgi:hypothetical protein